MFFCQTGFLEVRPRGGLERGVGEGLGKGWQGLEGGLGKDWGGVGPLMHQNPSSL